MTIEVLGVMLTISRHGWLAFFLWTAITFGAGVFAAGVML